MDQRQPTAIIADRPTLETLCAEEASGYVSIPRSSRLDAKLTDGSVSGDGIRGAIVIDPIPGEAEALRAHGISSVAWLSATEPTLVRRVDLGAFASVAAASPEAALAARANHWSLEPLAVCDDFFVPKSEVAGSSRVFFDGPTSERRDGFLQPVKHRFDVLHLVSGAKRKQHLDLISRCGVAIDLAEEPRLTRRNRIGTALAAGLLVLAQAPILDPGLVNGENVLSFESPDQLELLVSDISSAPDEFVDIRVAGRDYADRLRSSAVLPRIASLLPPRP